MIAEDARFLIDTNVFLEAARTYYHPSRSETFWLCLQDWIVSGRVIVLHAVAREILWPDIPENPEGEDFASRWLRHSTLQALV